MKQFAKTFTLSACALAASVLISACGGGAATDSTPPTVLITSAAGTAGAVSFSFAFSEALAANTFTVEDIVVTGGTAGTLTMVDATHYTLVVTPTSGAITATVAAAKFSDVANNANTASATNTYAAQMAASGSTGTCIAPTCTDFSAAGIGFGPFENSGGGTVELANDPNDSSNKVVKFVKKTGDPEYFGTTITGLVGPFVLTAEAKTITLRVWSPAVGTNFLLKLEGGTGGPAQIEKDMVTTKAGEWETLSFVMTDAGTYTTVVVFPNGRSKVATDTTMYIDELNFPAAAGGGGTSTSKIIDFSAAGIGFGPFENSGGGTVEIANDPTNAANKVVKFVKKVGDPDYFGTTITGLGGSVVLTPTAKTVTMRVWSPSIGTNFLLKFEGGTGGPAQIEKDMVTTKAGEWETLSFVMTDAGTYSTVVVFPNGRSKVASDTTMYIDDLTFPAFVASTGGSGSTGTFTGGIFASDYSGNLGANTAMSDKGGSVGFFQDPRLYANKAFEDGSVCGSACNPGGVNNFYYGIGKLLPALTDSWFGGFVNAPGNTTADASAFAKIKLKFWGDAESWEKPNFTAQVDVLLEGAADAACSNPSGKPGITKAVTAQKIGAGSEYIIPKTDFVLTESCGGKYTVNSIWSAVGHVVVRLSGTNLQYLNTVPSTPVSYPTFINIGPIAFIN